MGLEAPHGPWDDSVVAQVICKPMQETETDTGLTNEAHEREGVCVCLCVSKETRDGVGGGGGRMSGSQKKR